MRRKGMRICVAWTACGKGEGVACRCDAASQCTRAKALSSRWMGQWAEAQFSAGRAGAQHQGGPVKRGRNTKADQNGQGLKPFLLCGWDSWLKPTSPAVRQWTKQGSLGEFLGGKRGAWGELWVLVLLRVLIFLTGRGWYAMLKPQVRFAGGKRTLSGVGG